MNRKKPPLELPKGVEPEHEGHWAGWIKPDGSTSSVTAAHHDYKIGTPAHSYVLDHLGFYDYSHARSAGHARFITGNGWGVPFMDVQYDGDQHQAAQNVADFVSAHHVPGMKLNVMRYAGDGTSYRDSHDKGDVLRWIKGQHPGVTIKEDFDDIPKVGIHTPKGEKPHFDQHWAGWIQPDGSTYSMTDRAHGYEAGMEAHSPLSDELGFTSGYRGPLGFGFVRFVHGRDLKGQHFLSLGYDPAHPAASKNVADFLDAHHKKGMEITITHMHSRSPRLYGEDHYGHSKAAAKKWVKKHAPRQVAESEFMHTPFFRAMSHVARQKVREVHARKVLNPKGAWLPHGVEPEHDGEWGGFISPNGTTYSATDRRSGYHGGNAIHADLSYELGAPPHNRMGDYTLLHDHGWVRFTRSKSTWGRNDAPNFVFNYAKQHHEVAHKLVSDFLDKHHKPGVQINIARDWDSGNPYEGYDKEEAKEWLKTRASDVKESVRRMGDLGFWTKPGIEPEHNGSWGGWIHPDGRTYSSTDKHSGYTAGEELHRYLTDELGYGDSGNDYEPMNHGFVRFVHGKKNWRGEDKPYFTFNYKGRGEGAAKAHKLISDFLDSHYKPGHEIHVGERPSYDSTTVSSVDHAKAWMAHQRTATSESLIFRALSGESPKAIIEAIWPTLRSQMTSMKGKKVRPGVTLSQKKHTPFGFKAPTVITKRPTDVSQQPTHRRYRGQELEMQDNAGEISANVYGVHDLADLEIQRQQKGARPIVMRRE